MFSKSSQLTMFLMVRPSSNMIQLLAEFKSVWMTLHLACASFSNNKAKGKERLQILTGTIRAIPCIRYSRAKKNLKNAKGTILVEE